MKAYWIALYKRIDSQENIKNYVSYMDSIMVNKENVWLWLGEINHNELYSFGSPILWTLNPDDKNPKYYKSYVGPGQVTLIDYNLYYNDGNEVEYKKNYLKHYFQMIDDLFSLCFGKDHDFNIIDVYDCEKQINDGFSVEEFEEEENGYNMLSEKESLEKIGFNWKLFAESIGFKTVP